MPLTSLRVLILTEALHPFCLFQIAALALWSYDGYYFYSFAVLLITLFSFIEEIYRVRKNEKQLHEFANRETKINILIDKESFHWISSRDIVPGDIVRICPNQKIQFDCILLQGKVVLDEKMLTGENDPIIKQGYQPSSYYLNDCLVFCGSYVMDTKDTVLAVVINVGYMTEEGKMIRELIYSSPQYSKLTEDIYKYVGLLFLIASCGSIYTTMMPRMQELDLRERIMRAMDVFTDAVPPALPGALGVAINNSLSKLRNKYKITCISPSRILYAAQISTIVFDKTGTLSDEKMELCFAIGIHNNQLTKELKFAEEFPEELKFNLATCHSIDKFNSVLIGESLELEMLNKTEMKILDCDKIELIKYIYKSDDVVLISPKKSEGLIKNALRGNNNIMSENDIKETITKFIKKRESVEELGILRRYPFRPDLKRMTVLVANAFDNTVYSYTKGATEVILSCCNPASIPYDTLSLITFYEANGYRVLCFAEKYIGIIQDLDINTFNRIYLETELNFVGIAVFYSKPNDVSDSIVKLRKANIRCITATGDSFPTAISVSQDCKVIGIIQDDANKFSSYDDISLNLLRPSNYINVIFLDITGYDLTWTRLDRYTPNQIEIQLQKSKLRQATITNHMFLDENYKNIRFCSNHLHEIIADYFEINNYVVVVSGGAFNCAHNSWYNISDQQYTASSFNEHLYIFILKYGTIFSRMTPKYKENLVRDLKLLGGVIGMCGDGSNDCLALKEADIGISLSDGDACLAAPFTSNNKLISNCVDIIREGRAALIDVLQVVQFLTLQSIMQFSAVLTLYSFSCNFTDKQYLWIDLISVLPLSIVMSFTEASDELSLKRPPKGLFSYPILLNVIGYSLIQVMCYFCTVQIVTNQVGYKPYITPSTFTTDSLKSWENTCIFLVINFQIPIICLFVSHGQNWRKSKLFFIIIKAYIQIII